MAADFFRIERGFEIGQADGTTLVQILTDTAAPDTSTDAVNAPIGSLWIVNGGTVTTTRTYQKFQTTNSDKTDWRDVTQSISWREPAEVCSADLILPTATPTNTITVDSVVISDGGRVLFYSLEGYDTFDVTPATLGSYVTLAGANTYDFDVTIDGGALQQLSITLAGGETYTQIAALMSAQVAGGHAEYNDTLSAFVVYSNNTTSTSVVLLAAGTAGSGGGDLFAALATADSKTIAHGTPVAGPGSNIFVYDQAAGTFYADPGNAATDGDAVFIQQGTCGDASYFFNGTSWVQFGTGSALEEGYIRDFIGKDAAGVETPDYASPTTTASGDEAPNHTPFTDATSANGYVVNSTDNLELAIAKLNQEFFQNNRHLYATAVTSLADTLPTWVDGVKWMARIEQGTDVLAAEIHATTDGTNVDYTVFSKLKLGTSITGADFTVTVVGGQLILTVSSTANSTFEIRRMGTVGVPTTVGRGLSV